MDTTKLENWRNLKDGSIVTLSDEASIQLNSELGGGFQPMEYVVARVIEVEETDHLMRWFFVELEHNQDRRWLWIKIADSEMDLRVMHVPEEFQAGDRHDFLNLRDEKWIFQPPENKEDDWQPNDLPFTETIDWEGVEYCKKDQGDLCGIPVEKPQPEGDLPEQLATVAEYISPEDTPEPEGLLLEIGAADDDNGGVIKLMLGYTVTHADVDILAR